MCSFTSRARVPGTSSDVSECMRAHARLCVCIVYIHKTKYIHVYICTYIHLLVYKLHSDGYLLASKPAEAEPLPPKDVCPSTHIHLSL